MLITSDQSSADCVRDLPATGMYNNLDPRSDWLEVCSISVFLCKEAYADDG
jgi:hypothetical protein